MADALDGADRLLDATIDREEPIELSFEELRVTVPVRTGPDPPQAEWGLDGQVTLSVEGVRRPLAEWLAVTRQAREEDTNRDGEGV